MTYRFTAVVEKDPESGFYVGVIPGLPGAHTQAASLDELSKNLAEVVSLCLEETGDPGDLPEVVGTQLVQVEK